MRWCQEATGGVARTIRRLATRPLPRIMTAGSSATRLPVYPPPPPPPPPRRNSGRSHEPDSLLRFVNDNGRERVYSLALFIDRMNIYVREQVPHSAPLITLMYSEHSVRWFPHRVPSAGCRAPGAMVLTVMRRLHAGLNHYTLSDRRTR